MGNANHSAERIAEAKARADVYRMLERHFARLTTMQCPATWGERMRKYAEMWEAVADGR
jgi:hypothetical protein